jgi:diguanylate cyclase (GGDEF)-like protein
VFDPMIPESALTPLPGILPSRPSSTPIVPDDVLVFEQRSSGARLIGGTGRGAGWAEIVEFAASDEPLASRAWNSGMPVRVAGGVPTRIVGPYWAAHAIVVPLGQDHLVVFGSSAPLAISDATAVRMAAQAVAGISSVPAEKLLADELEVVHALRALMAYRPETVSDTARHIASVAARALSCEVGAVQVWGRDATTIEFIRLPAGGTLAVGSAGPEAAAYLRDAASLTAPRVEQTVAPHPRLWVEEIVSRMTLPIGVDERVGSLVLGHAETRPRGFTVLCQRIGRAIAESAELLLGQAIAREALAHERDALERASRTDHLTGVGNRRHWEEASGSYLRARPGDGSGPTASILSFDLDGLKKINDQHGHAVGDTVLRAAAGVILAGIRETDTLARVGGDEFLVLLPDATEADAARIADRIARVARRWRVSDQALSPELSAGWVAIDGDGLEEAVRVADERMYEAKRRRAKRREQTARRESAAKTTAAAKAPSKRRDRRSSPGHPAVGSA